MLAGAFAASGLTPALAHDQLVGTRVVSDPASGSIDAIELTFSDSIIDVGTEITVISADGAELADGPPATSGPAVQQDLVDDLPEGTATAAWRVVSSDGHPIEGAFGIEIAADGTAQIVAAAVIDPDTRSEDVPSAQEPAAANPPPIAIAAAAGGGVLVLAGVAGVMYARSRRSRGSEPSA